jgi:hypothetical protein
MKRLKIAPTLVTIDPGVNTAVCVFSPGSAVPRIRELFTVRGRGHAWSEKSRTLVLSLWETLDYKTYHAAFIEKPKPISTVALARGDQGKLDAVFGGILSIFHLNGVPIFELSFSEWKGQLPKRVTVARTKDTLGVVLKKPYPPWYPKNEHEWDALGMAVYVNKTLRTDKGGPWNERINHALERKTVPRSDG